MKSNEVRQKFLDFFAALGHRVVPSSSLIPYGDPTLLFTNAGMNQFKNVFLGLEKRDYTRAVSSQKCVRAGGKHNDLENVGKTARHHTFFEMLGNFSFGDYFKKEATAWAWELVTRGYGMDPQGLWISIHQSDEEAFRLWNQHVGVPSERIVRLGDKDNFWAMGDTGPCGPCSEIYMDQGPSVGCGRKECDIECECDRYMEFWNLVFMQYNRNEKGELIPLPRPSIDTGAGLERTTALIQGASSNFETDLLFPLIQFASEISGTRWKASEQTDIALKVLADHSRAVAFLISEGITPSNEGRGYVLRRIIRRALRYGRYLNFQEVFLHRITGKVVDILQDAYPELIPSREYVAQVCRSEEEKFKSVVENATAQLEEIFRRAEEENRYRLSGSEVFKLYDTFGLPVDFVQEMANERDFEIDLAAFEVEMERQRKAARAAWKGDVAFEAQDVYRDLSQRYGTSFTGYQTIQEQKCEILQILVESKPVLKISEGEKAEIVLNKTSFYAESGGQMGDRGILTGSTGSAQVLDTQTYAGLTVHKVQMEKGYFEMGDFVDASVDPAFRQSVRKNHTATHLLHAALRRRLGDHVKQSGSLVAPDRLRFDFTHYMGLRPEEVRDLERQVNERVLSNLLVETRITTLDEAMAEGAIALFGEKYGDRVRLVRIGDFSKELCGGTHCTATGEVGAFLVSRESSTAAGIRRIEAVTGAAALEYVQQERKLIEDLTSTLKISGEELLERVQDLMERNKKMEKEIERLRAQSMLGQAEQQNWSIDQSLENGRRIYLRLFPEAEADQLGNFVDEMFQRKQYAVVAAGSVFSGSLAVRVADGEDATGLFRKFYVAEFGGGGGGRKDFAKGGLKKLKELPAEESLRKLLKATIDYFKT